MGFGEAASRFAKDFSEAGLAGIVAYSRSAAKAGADDPIRARATGAGVELVATPKELCKRSNLVMTLTPGAAALPALRVLKRHLHSEHLYVDATTASVKDMERAAVLLEGRARFVDAAIMDAVPLNGIKVLTVASGPHAAEFLDALAPYGMNIRVIGDKPGAASAFKLMRSVAMKGLAAVLIEALEAAHRYGIADAVAADIARYMNERPFEQVVKRFVCGTAVHAERRVHEMGEAIALLKSLGSSTRMTRATRANLKEMASMGLRARFDAHEPDTIGPVLEALTEARSSRSGRSPRSA